jgi:hypothetical protein
MLKYLSKFTMDILPSVAATIIGAYIVNHYIVAKPGTDAPAAAVSSASPKKSVAAANLPEAGVRAKGISEKVIFDKSGFNQPTEKAAVEKAATEKASVEKSSTEKSDEKPAETASIPADSRRHAPVHEKTAIRTIPLTAASASPVQPATVVAPSAAPAAAPTVEAAIAPEDHRDANDLARAAIERLRSTSEASPMRAPETVRAPEPPRIASAPTTSAPQAAVAVRPLPPPIMVSTPSTERFGGDRTDPATGALPMQQPYPSSARIDDPRRPTPPADIPSAPPSVAPLDLQANAAEPPVHEHRNVALDMLSAAKSVFHAVLPQ